MNTFEHKGVRIDVDCDGMFCFELGGKEFKEDRLLGAQVVIDTYFEREYYMSMEEMNVLKSKLTEKERLFVTGLQRFVCNILDDEDVQWTKGSFHWHGTALPSNYPF